MKDLKLDEYHDLALEGGDLGLVDGIEEIGQAVRVELLTVEGEDAIYPLIGLPWNTKMFRPDVTDEEKKSIVKSAILNVDGVTSVGRTFLSIDKTNHSILIEPEIMSGEGPLRAVVGG